MNDRIYEELKYFNVNFHIKVLNPKSIAFHLHDTYEALFLISGSVNYFIDNNTYPLKQGDLIITNTTEIHAPVFLSSEPYERVVIHFSPELAKHISSPDLNLEDCFLNRKNGTNNKVSLNKQQIAEFMDMCKKLVNLNSNPDNYNIILKMAKLIEIIIFINQAFSNYTDIHYPSDMPEPLISIINYINKNIDSDLSLENLSNMFYVNKSYLCTLFKKYTDKTIHQYIIYKRIAYAKKLLQNGCKVSDACMACGFSDYSNFIKIFNKITGTTPGSYSKKS